jgi:hypothetical protein
MRLLKKNVLLRLLNSYLVDSPQPTNISYLWNFGVRRKRALVSGDCPVSIAYLISLSKLMQAAGIHDYLV